jgi:hypothetical protein
LRLCPFITAIALLANLKPVEAAGDPAGVWIPAKPDSVIERIHISGSPLDYIATIDYRCATAVCSTFQSLIADGARPPTYAVHLDGVGPAPVLALVWQRGQPCNRAGSDENPLAYWINSVPSAKKQVGTPARVVCLVRPPVPQSRQRR